MSKIIKTQETNAVNLLEVNFEDVKQDTLDYILPKKENLKKGKYTSLLMDMEAVLEDEKLSAVDCFHKLKQGRDDTLYVRFRFYVNMTEYKLMVNKFKDYGFKNLLEAVGVEEVVDVTEKSNSNYLVISGREKYKPQGLLSQRKKHKPITLTVPTEEAVDEEDFIFDDEDDE